MKRNMDEKVENNQEDTLHTPEEKVEKEQEVLEEQGDTEETLAEAEKKEDEEFEGLEETEEEFVKLRTLQEKNKKLENELAALKDRFARTLAEYDNFRRRTAKEKEGIYTDACEDVLKEMFPVLDNLERAMQAEGSVEEVKKGIEMTVRQFNTALQKLNVEEISSEGEFDPNFHNAVMHVEEEQYGKNQIVEVFQKGYKKGNKVLRYSMVKVAN